MTASKLPGVYLSASAASEAAQGWHLGLTRANLAALALVATFTGLSGLSPNWQHAVSIGTLLALLVALVLSGIARVNHFDRQWFAARAVAENVKSAMWHYIALPSGSVEQDKGKYLQALREIRQRLPHFGTRLASHLTSSPEVTPWMEASRAKSLDDRIKQFRTERLQNQLHWYTSRAKANAKMEDRLWLWIIILEGAGVLSASLQLYFYGAFNPIGTIAAGSAGLVAWSNTKRYADLSETYTVAAGDLALLDSQFDSAQTPATFEALVRDVEAAISREHSLWVTRRMT